jgi:hypothetical protein
MKRLGYVTGSGLLFALLQTGLFFQLQFRLTSAYPSYLAVTLAWLLGSLAGLWLGRNGRRTVWLAASLAAYYGVLILLRCFPYRIGCLPVYGLLMAVCGAQAGHFFAANRALFPSASRLFFWENNGIVLGWIAGFVGYIVFGNVFHWLAPVAAGVVVQAACGFKTDPSDLAGTSG